jgi:spermidine synthase
MACADDEYDLIVADLFRPHGAGESRLFSLEHFQNVKSALRSDGLFCQWLPAHQLNKSQFDTIANSFLQVFPNALVINGGIKSKTPSIGLCGWQNDKRWETEELVRKIQAIRNEKGVKDVLALNAQLLILGTLSKDAFSAAPINTLDNAFLEIDAGKFWITKDLRPSRAPDNLDNGFLSGANWKTFTQQLFQRTDPVLDPIHRQQYINALK